MVLGGYRDDEERGQMALALDEPTLAEVLSMSGYRTAMIGKWGLGGPNLPSGTSLESRGYTPHLRPREARMGPKADRLSKFST